MIPGKMKMDDSEKQNPHERARRSFVVSDFSVRDIPFAVLAFFIISAICIVLGLAVESLTFFWRGFVVGIAVALVAVGGLSLLFRKKEK